MDMKVRVQEKFECCGFQNHLVPANSTADYPSCDPVYVSPFLFLSIIVATFNSKCYIHFIITVGLFYFDNEMS